MTQPQRIQRKRTKGWRMPEGAIYVGRPTRWGNPFPVDADWVMWAGVGLGYRGDAAGRRAAAVAMFEGWLTGSPVKPGPDANDQSGGAIEFSGGSVLSLAQHVRNITLGFGALLMPELPEPPPLHELRGRDLACYCPLDQPCHADVLLQLANAGASA